MSMVAVVMRQFHDHHRWGLQEFLADDCQHARCIMPAASFRSASVMSALRTFCVILHSLVSVQAALVSLMLALWESLMATTG
jgi:hypothetical protein